jgi:predicted kinase
VVDVSVRGRVLQPTDRLSYVPGSLVVIVSGSREERDRFAQRVVEDKGAIVSLDKVRKVLKGRVADEELDEKASQLLDVAVGKRLQGGQSVILLAETASASERERFVRPAHAARRPRHLILLEVPGDRIASDDDRAALNELRRQVEAGGVGSEGFHTALRLGGPTIAELKRLVFREPPPED